MDHFLALLSVPIRDLALKIRCALKNKNPVIAVKHGSPLTVQDHEPVHR
jgi:hypothetical protein